MRILSMRTFLFVIAALLLSATTCSCSREDDPEEQKEEQEDKKVEDWENEDIDGDATMAPRMMFSLGDTIQAEGKVTTRATYTIVDEVEKCLLDEDDIVTIEVSGGTGSTRSTAKKNYKVGSDHTSLTYYEGTPSLNEFHWDYGTEKINIRAWSYGGTVADDATPITDPDGQTISLELNQKDNGYKELLYSPQQSDISFSTGKNGISMPLYHQMARVVVTLSKKASDDAATVSSITIGDGTAEIPTSGKFHKPTSGNYGTWGDSDNPITWTAATIKMKQEEANTKYSAVVIPTNYPKDLKFIYVTMSDGNKYAYTISDASGITLSAGNQYNFTISIGDDVATLQATYPTEWTESGYPINTYSTSDAFGVYVRKSDGTMLYSNLRMPASTSGSTVSLNVGEYSRKLSTSYTYFIYYPYKDSPGTVTTNANTAADFFSGVINSWTSSTNQSLQSTLLSCDMHIAMITGDGKKSHAMTASMKHGPGLIKVNMPSAANGPEVMLFDVNNSNTCYTNGSVTAYGLNYYSTSNSGVIPYKSSRTTALYIAKGGTTLNFVTPSISNTGTVSWNQKSATAVAGSSIAVTTNNTPVARDVAWQWNCSSSIKTYSVPVSGAKYQLEVWGAEGVNSAGYGGNPGMGGYTKATITLSTSYLYVGVGGQPSTSEAGYNGGGGVKSGGYTTNGSAGGGASHIAANSNRGVLSAYASNQTDVLVVAGGGGGADDQAQDTPQTWGYGGGVTAGPATEGQEDTSGKPYTKGTFGQGGHAGFTGASEGSGDPGSGGGGGWLGGNGTYLHRIGGGGTGKVNTDAKIGGSTTDLAGETIAGSGAYSFTSPTAYANTSTKESGHKGAGYARITILGDSY